jgi:hypothetical protein
VPWFNQVERTDSITHLAALNDRSTGPTSLSAYLLVVHKVTAELCAVRASRGERTVAGPVLGRSWDEGPVSSHVNQNYD